MNYKRFINNKVKKDDLTLNISGVLASARLIC